MGSGFDRGVVQRRLHKLTLSSSIANRDGVRRLFINGSCLDEWASIKSLANPSNA